MNFKWVGSLGTALLIIGSLLITGGIISVIQALDDFFGRIRHDWRGPSFIRPGISFYGRAT